MRSGRNDPVPMLMVVGLLIIIGSLTGILYFVSKGLSEAMAEDDETVIIKFDDVTKLPDNYNTTETSDDTGDDDTLPDETKDTTTVPDPTEDDSTAPPVYDHSFSGALNVNAQLIGVSGNPLSIVMSFVKQVGGEEIKELRIRYEWDFKLGKDLAPSTFKINVKGKLNKFYYQDLIDTYNKGEYVGTTIFDATGFDVKGYDTQTFKITDPRLRFIEVEDIGSGRILITTSTNSFILQWEATVSTTGGVVKKITGQTGIALRMYWDDYAQTMPDPSDPSYDPNMAQWYPYTYGIDPQTPLLSIVVK